MDPDLQPTLHQRCEWIYTFPFRVFLFNKYKIKPAPRWLGLEPHESDRKNICVSLCVHSFMHLASADLWPRASFIHIYHRGMQLILCVTAPSISQTNGNIYLGFFPPVAAWTPGSGPCRSGSGPPAAGPISDSPPSALRVPPADAPGPGCRPPPPSGYNQWIQIEFLNLHKEWLHLSVT